MDPAPLSVPKAVGHRIRQTRLAKGWSQEELADRAGLHRAYIGQIERAEKVVGIVTLAKIARALGLSLSNLIRF